MSLFGTKSRGLATSLLRQRHTEPVRKGEGKEKTEREHKQTKMTWIKISFIINLSGIGTTEAVNYKNRILVFRSMNLISLRLAETD